MTVNRTLLRHIVIILLLFSAFTSVFGADREYLEVTAPGNRTLDIAIAPPVTLSGSADEKLAAELAELFRFDLSLGPFTVKPAAATPAVGGITAGSFNFSAWKGTGSDLLVKSGYSVSGSTLVVECRLYDLVKETELAAKRYTGEVKDLRRIGHAWTDEVMRVVTGETGPFSTRIVFVSTATGNKELYLMDYDGHHAQRLTGNRSINLHPDFSPSGREILYTSYKGGNPDIYRRELFTGSEARLTRGSGLNFGATWAPDGRRIALAMSRDGHSQIYLMNRDGQQLARLTKSSSLDVSPAWSPDGGSIAFVSDRFGKPQIFVMDAQGKNVRRLTTNGSYNVSPRWSPKGDRIVYSRQEGGAFQIYSINADGTGDIRLTSEGSNEHPRWSPDGRLITFSSKRGGSQSIYVMRADGSGQVRTYRGTGSASHPAWGRF